MSKNRAAITEKNAYWLLLMPLGHQKYLFPRRAVFVWVWQNHGPNFLSVSKLSYPYNTTLMYLLKGKLPGVKDGYTYFYEDYYKGHKSLLQ